MTTRGRGRHAARSRIPFAPLLAAFVVAAAGITTWRLAGGPSEDRGAGETPPAMSVTPSTEPTEEPAATPTAGASPSVAPTPGPINTSFPGITTFRGNATRTYYGEGPVPSRPKVLWQYPLSGSLCSTSTAGGVSKVWCGTGWTGQPNVIPLEGGTVEIRFGAYDAHYHFLDGGTGEPLRPDLVTGDLAKGSATSDPDGYPLYYAGSRDNYLRVIALDRAEPTVLWSVNSQTSVSNPVWNSDWDGAPLVIGDYLLEGGENSWFYVIKLNRGYNANGKVTVHPRIVRAVPGWDSQLLSDIGDSDLSIENSVAFFDGVVYFANSGGLVQGWDISKILRGGSKIERVFRFWTGDDTDASIAIDEEGFLYVGSQYQRFNGRSSEVGQIMKLDPGRPKDPLVWSIEAQAIAFEGAGGTWSTPALYGDYVYAATVDGRLMEIKRSTGRIVWEIEIGPPVLSSPVPVDDTLIIGDCNGVLRALDISDPKVAPPELWRVELPGCIESTPAVWHGMIWVGSRSGAFYGIGDRAKG